MTTQTWAPRPGRPFLDLRTWEGKAGHHHKRPRLFGRGPVKDRKFAKLGPKGGKRTIRPGWRHFSCNIPAKVAAPRTQSGGKRRLRSLISIHLVPSRHALAAPIFLSFALHCRRVGILDLQPMADAAGAIGRAYGRSPRPGGRLRVGRMAGDLAPAERGRSRPSAATPSAPAASSGALPSDFEVIFLPLGRVFLAALLFLGAVPFGFA